MTLKDTNNKMLEAGPNLERSVAICQDVEKMFAPHHELYEKKTTKTV